MARTTDQAHTRLDLLEPRVTKIETTVHIQFKEVFARIKRLEAILIGAYCCHHCIVDKHHTDNAMICLLVGVYYQMVWPAKLQKVCHYRCPYFVGAMTNKDRAFIRYGEVCEPTKFVER
jgi:hypothetical protein